MAKFNQLTVKDIRRETKDCCSIAFEVPDDLQKDYQFVQGQYLTLRTEINGEDIRRSYSICTSPTDNDLRVAIKKIEGGKFSTFANDLLKKGDRLQVMTPMGNFYTQLDPNNAKHYVAFVAGSGITPVMAIMKTVLQREPKSRFTLVYGNKRVDSIIFRLEIDALKNRFMKRLSIFHFLTQEDRSKIPLFNGRMDKEKCTELLGKIKSIGKADDYFLCGPSQMIFGVKEALQENGVDEKSIHFELFVSPDQENEGNQQDQTKQTKKNPETSCHVKATLDSNLFEFDMKLDGQNVLDAALKAGLDLPFSCKGGVCCTCKAKLLKGEVDMTRNYALEPDEVENGYVLTCQAVPQTTEIEVDFDQL